MSKDLHANIIEGTKDALKYWDAKARDGATDCDRVEQSKKTQLMRFEAFLSIHNVVGKSILDIGCGTGDLWQYLDNKKVDCNYTGFDLSPMMINRCKERFPKVSFHDGNFIEWSERQIFDYTISIGIHNIRIPNAWDIFKQITRRQFEISKIAAHISILTDRYSGFAPHILAWKAEDILKMALEITPYVILRHDYLPNDFSITLYKEPLIDTIDIDFKSFT